MALLSNRDLAGEEIKELLADFRNKRALGLGSLFGDHQLEGAMCINSVIYLQNDISVACRSGPLHINNFIIWTFR